MSGRIWRFRNIELAVLAAAGALVWFMGSRAGELRIGACAHPPAWSRPLGLDQKPAGPNGPAMVDVATPGVEADSSRPSPRSDGPAAPSPTAPPSSPLVLTQVSPGVLRAFLAQRLPPATAELMTKHAAARLGAVGRWGKMHLSLASCLGVDARSFRAGAYPGLTPTLWQDLRAFLTVRTPEEARSCWRLYLGAFLVLFGLVHLFLRVRRRSGGELYLPAVLLFSVFTAVVLYQFNDPLRDNPLAFAYAEGALGAGAGLALVAGLLRLSDLERYKYLTIFAALGLSTLLVVFGSGPEGTDTKINLFGFQPVEFVKLLVVLFLAAYLSERENELRSLDAFRIGFLSFPRIRDVYPVVLFMTASLVLFFLQKDLGPALVLYLVFVCLFAVVSRRAVLGLAGLGLLTAAFWTCYQRAVFQTVTTRIEMWLSPWENHRPGGLQLAESLWAFASGGTAGSGPGLSSPQVIPAGHTDLILASFGEVYGFPAVALLLAASAGLFGMMVFHAYRTRHVYAGYLGFGLALLFGVQAAIISAGALGVLPLTGIPLPLVGYGKSATIASFLLIGLMINIASRPRPAEPRPVKLPWTALPVPAGILLVLLLAGIQAWRVMGPEADDTLVRPCLVPQADGVRRYAMNRRVLTLAEAIPRGVIRDRNGIPLALADPVELARTAPLLQSMGLTPPTTDGHRRVYPFGSLTVHLLGCFQDYWSDEQTVEKRCDQQLRGYKYTEVVEVVDGNRIVRTDFRGLAGAFRDRGAFPSGRLGDILKKSRDVALTLDIRLQAAAAKALQDNFPIIDRVPRTNGAAAVLDAVTGELLVCLSLPGYDPNAPPDPAALRRIYGPDGFAARDRCRGEIYPPGSTFKVVTAAAALANGLKPAAESLVCNHENVIPWTWGGRSHRRSITDDQMERAHGRIAMDRALVESCNVYFAWLGTRLGAKALFAFCRDRLGLRLDHAPTAAALEPNLPDNAYGQALVTVTPLEMARVAAMAAAGGTAPEPVSTLIPREDRPSPPRALEKPDDASKLHDWMVRVVTAGTGCRAAVPGLVVGGKTGTAQTASGDKQSHAWFIGFAEAPSEEVHPLAFAFLIENGGYGGRASAPVAHDFLLAAKDGNLFPRPSAYDIPPAQPAESEPSGVAAPPAFGPGATATGNPVDSGPTVAGAPGPTGPKNPAKTEVRANTRKASRSPSTVRSTKSGRAKGKTGGQPAAKKKGKSHGTSKKPPARKPHHHKEH